METLATEVLHELKLESRRRFILLIITIILLFSSNIAWLVAWNLPDSKVSEEFELEGDNGANVMMNTGNNSMLSNEVQSE